MTDWKIFESMTYKICKRGGLSKEDKLRKAISDINNRADADRIQGFPVDSAMINAMINRMILRFK